MTLNTLWKRLGALLGAIVLVGGAWAVLAPLGHLVPATRGYVDAALAAEDASSASQFNALNSALLDIRIATYDASISQLSSQLTTVQIRLVDTPHDALLQDFERKLKSDIAITQNEKQKAVCQKFKLTFGASAACH